MSAVRRNGRRTIFCWCKSACAKAPAAQEKPVRTLSAQKNAGRFAPGNTAFLGRFVQMRRENGRILHKNAACFCTLCLVVTNVRGNTPYFPSHLPSSPRKGDVDRNIIWRSRICRATPSSPRKGDVDRNTFCRLPSDLYAVVPRKGDVDRNYTANGWTQGRGKSSPARGTWIEISASPHFCQQRRVVPRKGDVDRNITSLPGQAVAWVVPRKGDVDRNSAATSTHQNWGSRPPQGGRG